MNRWSRRWPTTSISSTGTFMIFFFISLCRSMPCLAPATSSAKSFRLRSSCRSSNRSRRSAACHVKSSTTNLVSIHWAWSYCKDPSKSAVSWEGSITFTRASKLIVLIWNQYILMSVNLHWNIYQLKVIILPSTVFSIVNNTSKGLLINLPFIQ